MHIFTAVRHSLDPRFCFGGLWSNNFYPAMQQLGHEIVESQIDLLPASNFIHVSKNFTKEEKKVRAKITQQIVDEVRRVHGRKPIDLFLSYFYNAHFDPDGFDEIHKLGVPTVNFYGNSLSQLELVEDIAKRVNFSWHPEKNAKKSYLRIGANPVWVQLGADPQMYRPVSGVERQSKACFIGTRYTDRSRWLAGLIAGNVSVDIYGRGWMSRGSNNSKNILKKDRVYLGRRQLKPGTFNSYINVILENIKKQGTLRGIYRTIEQFYYRQECMKLDIILTPAYCGFAEDISDTFARYEAIINFNTHWSDGRPGSELVPEVNLRDFEAPMCRTCYITGYTDEIAEFYELGKEIDTYRTQEELSEKIKFYLSHPAEAEKLREKGYKRASRDHTWTKRFELLFKKIGLA